MDGNVAAAKMPQSAKQRGKVAPAKLAHVVLKTPPERVKLVLVAAASLATAAAVSVSGLIGFVGLIAPHAARLMWGHDYRSLVPMAMIVGAAFLILADLAARTALRPAELPVGVVTAFVGAPFFLYLLRQRKGGAF